MLLNSSFRSSAQQLGIPRSVQDRTEALYFTSGLALENAKRRARRDRTTLQRLGTTPEAVAMLVRKIVTGGNRRVHRLYEVKSDVYLSASPCPLCDGVVHTTQHTIISRRGLPSLEITEAGIHLLEKHGLLGRLDPEALAQSLGIKKMELEQPVEPTATDQPEKPKKRTPRQRTPINTSDSE